MWKFLFFMLGASAAHNIKMSPFSFCSDMNPQQHVNIEQLLGMWYGIEILTHNTEEHYVRIGYTCPVLHLSKEKEEDSTTYNSLYNDYNYGYNYGERRPPNRPTNRPQYEYDEHGRRIQTQYDRNYNTNRRYDTKNYNRRDPYDVKRLRIWWDENGKAIEYHLKYNTSRPGFWISSGPENGSLLDPKYSNFAGTVQVIKAVGNHLVLNFCHQLPERQLSTIILSRENILRQPDIHSVHSLLNRKGLTTNAVTKVCFNGSGKIRVSLEIFCLIFFHYLFRFN